MSSVSSSENVFPDNDAEWSNRFLVVITPDHEVLKKK